jgi:adenosylcobalamin-dependent ribonucleoside-triphosphate reductase
MLSEAYLDQYRDKKIPFGPVGEIVYKRTYSREKEEGVKESWLETQARCVNSIAEMSKGALTQKEQEELFDLVFNLKGSFSGRGLWQLGTDTVDRFGLASLNNCWAVAVDKPEAFCFTFDMLMLGGGVGFNIQREFVYRLPSVTPSEVQIKHVKGVDADFMVPDSREGWVDLLWRVLEVYFDLDRPYRGRTRETKGFTYSTANIRGKGEAILGFGGKASGPQVLVDGIEQICTVFSNRRGKMLRPIDCLDIMNIIGSVVVAGNVRRSAQIALGDTDDYQFLEAKRWDRGTIPNWRAMSNNTFIANEFGHIREETWLGYEGKGEPYGFLNLNLVKNYGRLIDGHNESDIHVIGTNPCGEISLEDGEACNLNETFAPNIKTEEELIHTLCSVFRTSKIITTLPCHWGLSEEVIHRNRRIGTSLTGIWQSELLTPKVLDRAYKALEECDEEFSRRLSKATGQKVEKSIKRTTVKPSGTLSLLAGVAPGIHPEFANHYIRRIRMASTDPLVNQCREAGYFVEYVRRFDGTEDHDTVCVEFPVEARPGKVADDNQNVPDLLER